LIRPHDAHASFDAGITVGRGVDDDIETLRSLDLLCELIEPRHIGGDEGDEVFLIRSGVVRILLPLIGGKRHHLATFGRGDFFGEMAFLDKGTRTADAEARTDCEVYVLSRREFNIQVRSDAVLGTRVFARLARAVSLRLRQTDAELRTVEDR